MLHPAETPSEARPPTQVSEFRQILLWPLRLVQPEGTTTKRPWERLHEGQAGPSPWRELADDAQYTGNREHFHERHYNEFVTFLPYVQRFLYGEGSAGDPRRRGAPMRVFRRDDVAALRVRPHASQAPIEVQVVHVDLYFFLDLDVVLLNVELAAQDLGLSQAQELLYRFGRGYPPGWDAEGQPLHCMASAEWLDAQGAVLVRSDSQDRDAFMAHVCAHRAPRLAAHWAWLLEPLVADSDQPDRPLRFRQIEYYRMPMMGYLALQDPQSLSRNDFIRLGMVTGPAPAADTVPYAEHHLANFEQTHCYDRFWSPVGAAPYTRYLCSGHALVVVGSGPAPYFVCPDRGVLAQFRHQHFLLFMIAHLQKAALVMYSDRLVEALRELDVADAESVKRFKRAIRTGFESFLRFSHRYWFHEVSEQAQMRALFRMTADHLRVDALYAEVKERMRDMNEYLEADSLRRQANTVVRLTVVTIFGLIGTVTTGFLGMNLLAEAEAPLWRRSAWFIAVFGLSTAITVYTMIKSKRLSDFLDALSDERLSLWQKGQALAAVWKK